MRILQVNSSKTFGGGERHFVDLCRGLSDAEQDVYTVVRPGCEWSQKLDFLDKSKQKTLAMLNSADILSAGKLTKMIRSNNIDIIHAHLARDYPLAAIASLQATGARLVITRHVMFPLKNINRLLLRNVDAAIGVSEGVAQKLRAFFPKEKVVCVPNGINVTKVEDERKTSREFRFEHDIDYDDVVVSTVGELKKLKGHEDFIRAAKVVTEKFDNARFVIVGRDSSRKQQYRKSLFELAKDLGIEDRIVFIDWLESITPLIVASDAFVSCSHSESFGLSILEAMAHRKPIVATSTDGAKELIRDREDGILVTIGESNEIGEAINEVLSDQDLSRNLSAAAEATALERFGVERMIEDTLRVYRYIWNS